jgi:hypothetical protein
MSINLTAFQQKSHGWRVKRLKGPTNTLLSNLQAPRQPEGWTPGPHNCDAAKTSSCFCSGKCRQPNTGTLSALSELVTRSEGFQHLRLGRKTGVQPI